MMNEQFLQTPITSFDQLKGLNSAELTALTVDVLAHKATLPTAIFDTVMLEDLSVLPAEQVAGMYAVVAGSLYAEVMNPSNRPTAALVREQVYNIRALFEGVTVDPQPIMDLISERALWNKVISADAIGYLVDPQSLHGLHKFPIYYNGVDE